MTRPTRPILPTVLLAACLAAATPAEAAPATPEASSAGPKGVKFLTANQWPQVPGWGKWSGSSKPDSWTVLLCGVNQLPKPYADTNYRPAKKQGIYGRQWISDAGSKKAATKLVRSFGDELKYCADGYGKYTPHPSSATVVNRTPKRSNGIRIYAQHLMVGYSNPPRPAYNLWGIGQRGRFVVVVELSAGGPHAGAPVKGFIKTARAAVARVI